MADFHTRGRGQAGNTWVSQSGKNLLFSILVCPSSLKAVDGFVLSQAMALAIKETLDPYISGVLIKWPNDIYCRGRKICGTLIENSLAGAFVARSVIGSGINVNQTDFPEGLAVPPTSLHMELGHEVLPEDVLREVLSHFREYYVEVQRGRFENIRERYHAFLYMRAEPRTFRDDGGEFVGRISHVESTGHLVIHDEAGKERRYAFKEVKML